MAQKVLAFTATESTYKLKEWLDDGWNVKFVVAENVAVSQSHAETYGVSTERGKIVYIIEKP